jgi:pimeloyl-ACP methyl ester carboxylesterase
VQTYTRSSVHREGADGRTREYQITVPESPRAVVLAFHPYGFDPEAVLDGEQPGLRLERPFPGLAAPAARLGFAVVAPRGLGKVQPLAGTLGYPEHIDAAVAAASAVASEHGGLPIVTLGVSLGGQETLLAAGRHPDVIAAVCAVNPIGDLGAWYDDMVNLPISILADIGVPGQVAEEVGGTPAEVPELYLERSAFGYLDALSTVPVQVVWSPVDNLIPNGKTKHAGRLADLLRGRGAPVSERILTNHPTEGQEPGRYAHESFDAWAALGFLLDRLGR